MLIEVHQLSWKVNAGGQCQRQPAPESTIGFDKPIHLCMRIVFELQHHGAVPTQLFDQLSRLLFEHGVQRFTYSISAATAGEWHLV